MYEGYGNFEPAVGDIVFVTPHLGNIDSDVPIVVDKISWDVGIGDAAKKHNAPWVVEAHYLNSGKKVYRPKSHKGWSRSWFRKDVFLTGVYKANKALDSSDDQTYDISCQNP